MYIELLQLYNRRITESVSVLTLCHYLIVLLTVKLLVQCKHVPYTVNCLSKVGCCLILVLLVIV